MRYMQIVAGRAVNALKIEDPAKFPAMTLVQSNTVDIGDLWDGSVFSKDPALEAARLAAQAEALRLAEIDQTLKADTVIAAIAAMNNAQWDTFWTNRTAEQKDKMLKFLVRAEARRRVG
jgi:hypothetical protein